MRLAARLMPILNREPVHHNGWTGGLRMKERMHVPSAQEILMLESIGKDRFRARYNIDNYAGAAFGGQLLGQALAAARVTVEAWSASSISGTFFRAGNLDAPIDYRVERVGDGRRFAFRDVTAFQREKPIFAMHCTFHAPQDGVSHQVNEMGRVQPPEELPDLAQFALNQQDGLSPNIAQIFGLPFPVELRPIDPEHFLKAHDRDFWFRVPTAAAVSDLSDHQALLAMMSDYWLPGAIMARHSQDRGVYSVTSLNHALWFHHAVRADDWLLYRATSHWAGHGRGLAQGLIFDLEGRLAASTTQEALISRLPDV